MGCTHSANLIRAEVYLPPAFQFRAQSLRNRDLNSPKITDIWDPCFLEAQINSQIWGLPILTASLCRVDLGLLLYIKIEV